MDKLTCVLALMTAIPNLTEPWNRVVMVGDYNEQNYRVHYTPGPPSLPIPQDEKILVTPYRVSKSGTSLMAYCSFSLGMQQIVENVFPQASKLLYQPDIKFAENKGDYDNCEQQIYKLNSNPRIEIEIERLESTRCTHAIISQLALKSKLRVTGRFKCYAPYENTRVPTIHARGPVRLTKDVWKPIMSVGDQEEPMKYVLAWFQGHLYVFQIYWGDSGYWQLLTPIGNEKNNGRIIYDFVFKNNPDLLKLMNSIRRSLSNHDIDVESVPSRGQIEALNRKEFRSLPTLHTLKVISITAFLLCDAPKEP
ncbi:BgTH12-02152 [Blumeria graminis f. sp. triticale]|uniref:BgtE-5712 n=3 Tax=Blumeria graminis TaxID=34373 RepID=A0A381L5H8_BLUGR|nr:putative secreted effector protein [Blumeria graminis f. sp. tritici 96224]CAD6501907.1 BgTH12-02152 [Blumeria graminis f. sp. triticale]VDB85841.1 BgtE-5712 [Blumeria graminis f. sp. tritici]